MKILTTGLITSAAFVSPALAITITLDFSHSSSGFFDTGTADGVKARASVEAAAADLSAVITSSLNALSTYHYEGTSSGTTVELDASLGYTNPDTDASESFSGSLAVDEFKIFVGARSLSGSTLGQGGPGSVGVSAGISSTNASSAQAAGDIASGLASAGMTRGAHTVSTLGGGFGSPFNSTYSVEFGPTLGNLWFDNDVSTTWNLDHTVAPGGSENDLYSVALHEILHSLGVGVSDAWDSNVSGTDWTGAEAIAENGGSGVGLIDGGGGHIAADVMSTRLSDGVAQEVVMDPNITVGTRKELTDLDLAFLRDIGWQTVPEPSSTALLGVAGLGFVFRRKRV
ncbi:MAG: PEP-CTERM sorting domain-containing protein [Akkermansiaceae bacterium]